MKSIVIHAARDLRIEDREPGEPGPGEVAIAVKRGGICGSDLHYYLHGGFGVVRLKEPMILGHEVAGEVVGLGVGVAGLAVGDLVAVNPSRPCGQCSYCQQGLQNQCAEMRFYGSAMRVPHIQGAFSERLIASAAQCFKLAPGIPAELGAFAEPFAVTLHAVHRGGSLLGRRVLVTGCGPIGALAIIAARSHGAREIVATDVTEFTLELARRIGADRAVNVATDAAAMEGYKANKGAFDVMIEASGNERAVRLGLDVLKPRGVLVQLGLGGEISLPQNQVVAKEIEIRGSFRFHEEFGLAVDLINRRRVDLAPLLSGTVPLAQAEAGFKLASDRSKAMKVQIAF